MGVWVGRQGGLGEGGGIGQRHGTNPGLSSQGASARACRSELPTISQGTCERASVPGQGHCGRANGHYGQAASAGILCSQAQSRAPCHPTRLSGVLCSGLVSLLFRRFWKCLPGPGPIAKYHLLWDPWLSLGVQQRWLWHLATGRERGSDVSM